MSDNKNDISGEIYKQMYLTLFNAVTTAIEILQQVQKDTEGIYIVDNEKFKEVQKTIPRLTEELDFDFSDLKK